MIQFIVMIVALILSVLSYKKVKQIQTQKGTSKALIILSSISVSFLVFVITIVIGASIFTDTPTKQAEEKKQNKIKVLSVSDFSYTMKGKQSVSISFGTSKTNYYEITIHRDKIKPNTKLIKNENSYIGSIDGEANINKKHYVFLIRDGLKSYIDFKIETLDYTNKQAIIIVSLKLYNPNNEDYIEIKNQKLNITGALFDNLVKQIHTQKIVNKDVKTIDIFDYLKDSPEYVFANFINAWALQDFKKMANYTQLSWKSREKNPSDLLKNQYDFKHIKSAKIVKIDGSGSNAYKITANIKYTTPFHKDKIENVFITGMVIKENGIWGVNPISTLREF